MFICQLSFGADALKRELRGRQVTIKGCLKYGYKRRAGVKEKEYTLKEATRRNFIA